MPIASAQSTIVYSPPLIVNDSYIATYGNVITGNYQGTLTQPAISISTSQPVIISNANVIGPKDLIYASPGNLMVINTNGYGINPNQANVAKGDFVHVENAINVLVQNCTAQDTAFGVYIHSYNGNFTSSNTIQVLQNQFSNMDARPSDGNGGYVTSGNFKGHAIQLNQINSVPGIVIAWNQIINQPRVSQVNDNINIYNTSGTTSSPLFVHDNYIQGAYPTNPGVDKYSGGGIICDGSASATPALATAFVEIYNNQVVSTANYGLAIASGHDNSIYNNRVVASGYLADGTFVTGTSATALYNWNADNQSTTTFYNNLVSNNNPVGLVRPSSSGAPMRADWYFPGQANSAGNVSWVPKGATAPTLNDEANEITLWQNKLIANGIVIGSQTSN